VLQWEGGGWPEVGGLEWGWTEPNEFYDELLRLLLIYVSFVCVALVENAWKATSTN